MSPRRLAHLAAVTHLRESVALVLAASAVPALWEVTA